MTPRQPFVFRPRTIEDLREQLSGTPEEIWSDIEDEDGPLDLMSDAALKQRLTTRLSIAVRIFGQDGLRVPPAVFVRLISAEIDRLRREARAAGLVEVKQKLIDANRLLQRCRASLPRRPKHRPAKSFARRIAETEAIHEFDLRRRQLMRSGHARDEAIDQAAEKVAFEYGVKPATLISWWQHPGRRRPKPRRRRPTTQE
jgi:hypothetical protein